MLGRKQSLLDILNSIIYVVLAGNNFLHLATKRKEEEIGPENVAILFFFRTTTKEGEKPTACHSITCSPPPNFSMIKQIQAAAVDSAKLVSCQMGLMKETTLNRSLPSH